MDITIELYDELTRQQLRALEEFNNDFTEPLKDIGLAALRSIDLNYQNQTFVAVGGRSQAAINRNGMTLVHTGRLRRSTQVTVGMEPVGSDKSYRVSPVNVEIGTQVPYYEYLKEKWPAIVLQEGDPEIFKQIMLRHLDNI